MYGTVSTMSIQPFLRQELLAQPHFDCVYYYYYFLSDNINAFLNIWLFCLSSYLSIQRERPSWESHFGKIKVSEVERPGCSSGLNNIASVSVF